MQKLEFLAAYEDAWESNEGGAFLRREGLYSSQMSEWRRLRDAGVLAGKKAGESIGKLSAEQAENARLRRQLEVSESRLKKTEAALDLMGKLQAFLEMCFVNFKQAISALRIRPPRHVSKPFRLLGYFIRAFLTR